MPAKVHKAIKEKYNAKFLKDASYVLWFWDKSATAPEDDESGEDSNAEVEEAESPAGGFTPELKTQVIKSIMKVFHCQTKEEVDTFDLDLSGKSYFFVKLSWK